MNIFLFVFVMLIFGWFMLKYFFGGINAKSNEEKWLDEIYSPKQPSKFKIWLCRKREHNGQASHYIEQNADVKKIKCLGCGTVYLRSKIYDQMNNYENI